MKSTPILFTPENAQKVHAGTKTQTRRILKPQPTGDVEWFGELRTSNPKDDGLWSPWKGDPKDMDCWEQAEGPSFKCPYGTIGDRLWVREAFISMNGYRFYRGECLPGRDHIMKYKPSIHMPKAYCRTFLELTAVRVERLHDITETDAIAEGCVDAYGPDFHVGAFRKLWESNKIHKPGSWDLNPWVWVLSFKKVMS